MESEAATAEGRTSGDCFSQSAGSGAARASESQDAGSWRRGRHSPSAPRPKSASAAAGQSVATLAAAKLPPSEMAAPGAAGRARRLSSGQPEAESKRPGLALARVGAGGPEAAHTGASAASPATSAAAEASTVVTEAATEGDEGSAAVAAASAYDDQLREALAAAQESGLLPLKEDVADWLTRLLGVDVSAGSLMELLEDGTLLCKLARLIDERLQPAAPSSVKFHSRAPAGSFLARDNAASFLSWARDFGVEVEFLFESDGLVLRKDPRRVVLCLLGIARIAASRGLPEAPALVVMEREMSEGQNKKACEPPQKTKAPRPLSSAGVPMTQAKMSPLDSQVAKLTAQCQCPDSFQLQKIDDGVYILGGKQCLVRLLRDRHVMVRVGGGWDSLEHYLLCHDPCRMLAFRREGASATPVTGSCTTAQVPKVEDRFLHVKGRYKSLSGAG